MKSGTDHVYSEKAILPAGKAWRVAGKSPFFQDLVEAPATARAGQRTAYAAAMAGNTLAELRKRREAIAREIAGHPRPITGCDVHFNRLLEERAALAEEIDRLEALENRGDALSAADAHRD
jgi:hypothetical protein